MHELGHSHANLGDEYITSDDRGVDMSIYADSSPNTTTNNDPYNVKWSHWIQDKTSVPGYTSGASNSGVGLFLGTYYSSDASWRPEDYNVMYGGDYNGGWGVPENFISQYGPINTEAFVAQTISKQCFNQYRNDSTFCNMGLLLLLPTAPLPASPSARARPSTASSHPTAPSHATLCC